MIRVMIVDDHPVVRAGLTDVLGGQGDILIVGTAGSAGEALGTATRERPDVAVMDLRLPDSSGAEPIARLRSALPACGVLAISSFARPETVRAVVEAGARGFLLKDASPDDLRAAVRAVAAGRRWFADEAARALIQAGPAIVLTPRERGVLTLMAAGLSTKEIAHRLGVAEATAGVHAQNVLEKLGVSNRAKAVAMALAQGLVDIEGLQQIQ